MAIVENLYTGNGSTTLYSFTFPYLEESDVKVTLNGTPTTAYVFASATSLQFLSAPGAGVAIRIYRETDDTELAATFFPGSSIRAADLNNDFDQLLYLGQESSSIAGKATVTANTALANSNTAISTANAAVVTANAADAAAAAAVITANTAESNSLAAVSTANTASSNASAAVITANAASSAASSAVSTANDASSTANQAAIDAAAAVVTANAADGKADAAVLTANAADANASAAVITANAADVNASAAVVTANTAESNSLSAISTANSAAAAVASAVVYQPVTDLAALALLTPLDGEFFELQDSTGADTDPSITGVPVGLVGSAGLTFRLRYDDPPGEYAFLGYFANDSETRYLKTGTGTVTSTNILDGTIVDADINASAAIAGTKVSPNFGSQTVQTTGVISHALGSATAPTVTFTGDPNTGIYSPGADQVAISTNGTGRLFVDASGNVQLETGALRLRGSGNSISADQAPATYLRFAINSVNALDIQRISTSGAQLRVAQFSTGGTAAGWPVLANAADTNTGIFFPDSSDTVGITTGATERLRITADGKLGLGTSSPDALLTVNGVGAFGAGTAALPSIARSSDLDTGAWFPAANTIAASTAGVERLRIDSTGRVGIGTTSPGSAVEINAAASTSPFIAKINNAESARIDSSGRVLIGTSTASGVGGPGIHQVSIAGSSASTSSLSLLNTQTASNPPQIGFGKTREGSIVNNNDVLGRVEASGHDGTDVRTPAARIDFAVDGTPGVDNMPGRLVFSTTADGASSPTERMRIDNAGNTTLSTLSSYLRFKSSSNDFDLSAQTGATDFLRINANSTQRFQFTAAGTAFSSTGTWGTISDARIKENIADATDKLEDLKKLRVVNYNLKSDPEIKQIGFVAQEIEEVFPSMVETTGNEGPVSNVKAVKTTVLVPILVKALQEAIAKIETLEAKVAALEAS
jgi:hypothetical protein